MSVCGQTEDDSASEDPATPPPPGASLRDMYEQKAVSKVVRVLTVLAYLLSVSLAAILLSVYYVCVWKPVSYNDTEPKVDAQVAHEDDYHGYHHRLDQTSSTPFFISAGGGDTSMSEATSSTPNIDSPEPSASDPSPSPLSTSLTPTASSEFNLTWFSDNYTTTDGPT